MGGLMLERGVSIEVVKIACHLEFDNLIVILDANVVTLDNDLSKQQRENIGKKYDTIGFGVFQIDGNDIRNINIIYTSIKFSEKLSKIYKHKNNNRSWNTRNQRGQ